MLPWRWGGGLPRNVADPTLLMRMRRKRRFRGKRVKMDRGEQQNIELRFTKHQIIEC